MEETEIAYDPTYDREQRKYRHWVDAQIQLGPCRLDDEGWYLTTYNVELYFHSGVPNPVPNEFLLGIPTGDL